MLSITGTQFKQLDRLYARLLEEHVVQELEIVFGARHIEDGTPPSTPFAEVMRLAREHAARLGILAPVEFAAVAAILAGYSLLPATDMAKFRESIAPLFARSASQGSVVLALVQSRMQALAEEHPFAARMLDQVAAVRHRFE